MPPISYQKYNEVIKERDQLRAELKRLREQPAEATNTELVQHWQTRFTRKERELEKAEGEIERLRDQNQRLQEVQDARILLACPECEKLKARVAELEAAQERIDWMTRRELIVSGEVAALTLENQELRRHLAELEAAQNLQSGQRYATPAEIDAALNADTTAVYTIPDAALNEPMSRKQFVDAVLHELTARGLLASREIAEQAVREAGIQPDRFGFFTQKHLDDFKAHFRAGASHPSII